MNQEIYAIKDRATQSFGQPMFLQTRNQAIRMFHNEVNRAAPDNPLHTNPADFELYKIGNYNTDTGGLIQDQIELAARAQDLKEITK